MRCKSLYGKQTTRIMIGQARFIWCCRYKTQTVNPPLSREDLDLQPHETPYLRTHRILRHLRAANDSRVPGYHATTGSDVSDVIENNGVL